MHQSHHLGSIDVEAHLLVYLLGHQPLDGPVGLVDFGGLVGSVELEVIAEGWDVTWIQCEVNGVGVVVDGEGSSTVDGLVTCETSQTVGSQSMDVV